MKERSRGVQTDSWLLACANGIIIQIKLIRFDTVIDMGYDSILSQLGEFGTYQKQVYTLVWIIALPHAFHMVNFVFLMQEPSFRCAVPGLENDTYHIQNEHHGRLINASIPLDSATGYYSECRTYSAYWNRSYSHNSSLTVLCDRWIYDHDTAPYSMVPEFNLVCDREIYKTHLGMGIMVGLLVGSIFGGTLSDYFGRKPVMMTTLALFLVLQTSITFTTSIISTIVLKSLASAIGLATYMALYVLVAELVGPTKRAFAGLGVNFSWTFSIILTVVTYYFISDWRTAQLITTIPWIVLLLSWWLIDESLRWLMIKNKQKEAMKVIRKMTKKNRMTEKQKTEGIDTLGFKISDHNEKQEQVWTLFQNKTLFFRLVILGLNWGMITMCYYGYTLNVGDMIQGNLHLNMVIQSFMESGAIAVCLFCSTRIGRKRIYCACIFVGGVACLMASVLPLMIMDVEWINMTLFTIGKFGIGGAFASIYLMTTELIPTSCRNFGLGLCSLSGRVFGVIAPYIATLIKRLLPTITLMFCKNL